MKDPVDVQDAFALRRASKWVALTWQRGGLGDLSLDSLPNTLVLYEKFLHACETERQRQ